MTKNKNISPGEIMSGNRKTLENLRSLMKELNQNISIKVGILQPQASQKVEGTDLNNAELGAVHEFGATINTKNRETITIPARSFLRVPILGRKGQNEIKKVIDNEISSTIYHLKPENISDIMDNMAHTIAETAFMQVNKAFEENTIQPPTTEQSKKQRKNDKNGPTLQDTGQLRRSISYAINGKQWGKYGK